ncbi:MAG: TIM barrel protein [Candidatus Schekmanbacteria bacterium]|nr:TIM barrel protein [Candidatus Schekmanbacteria bacterium]
MYVGVACCDVLDWARSPAAWGGLFPDLEALELQPELVDRSDALLAWSPRTLADTIHRELPNLRWLDVHAPSSKWDLSSLRADHRRHALDHAWYAYRWARELGARAFVLHPGAHGWVSPGERADRAERFAESFAELARRWHAEIADSRAPRILLENLEYAQPCATPRELAYLVRQLHRQMPIGACLDVPHLWHSRRVLHLPENGDHRATALPPPDDSPTFGAYLDAALAVLNPYCELVHLAGCGLHRTHDPIRWTGNGGPPYLAGEPGEGVHAMLDLRPVLCRVFGNQLCPRPPALILEVYEGGLPALQESLARVISFRNGFRSAVGDASFR